MPSNDFPSKFSVDSLTYIIIKLLTYSWTEGASEYSTAAQFKVLNKLGSKDL